MILAHWTYSKQEWKAFIRAGKKQKGFVTYLLHWLFPFNRKKIPEIKITPELVSIGSEQQYFRTRGNLLTDIHIREEGVLNIIEIGYENASENSSRRREIIIPVPKGKLREAFEVEERLLSEALRQRLCN